MHNKSAIELRNSFLNGEISSVEIVTYFLERVEKLNPKTNAFIAIYKEEALEKAFMLDQKKADGKTLGKLASVPISIKDNIVMKGKITTCSSKFLQNYTSPYDATVIADLEKEDAIIIGKTNLDEFAMGSSTETSINGTSLNPWDLNTSPGGSSGGSSAAVSARLTPISLGTDTGGSIRQPAAFTGTYGFKPTYGRVSRYGLVAFASSLDQIGPFANNVEDIALTMEVLGHHCKHDATSLDLSKEPYLDELSTSIQGKTIGVPWHFLESMPEKEQAVFNKALETYETLGANIQEIKLNKLKYSVPIYYIIASAEASTNLARFDGIRYGLRSTDAKNLDEIYKLSRKQGFGSEVKQRVMLGTFVLSSGFQDAYYKKAQKVRALIVRDMNKAFETCDVIAMPTTQHSAFEINSIKDPLSMYLQDLYTICANMAGIPAISVPSGLDESGMPLGIQIMGPRKEDARVLRFAHHLEKELKLPLSPPNFDKEG